MFFIAHGAGQAYTSNNAILIGVNCGASCTSGGGVFIGANAGQNATSANNTFVGASCGTATTAGVGNACFGSNCCQNNAIGNNMHVSEVELV